MYKAQVVEAFSKNNNSGTLKNYKVGDTYMTSHLESIEYLKKIKKVK